MLTERYASSRIASSAVAFLVNRLWSFFVD
jgi:hypothetical protein